MSDTSDRNTSTYDILSIRLSTDGFSFSLLPLRDPAAAEYHTFAIDPTTSLTANLEVLFAAYGQLVQPVRQVNVLVDTDRLTVMPHACFDERDVEDFFYFNLPHHDNETVLSNVLGDAGMVLTFGMDRQAYRFLVEHYPAARFFCSLSGVITYLTKHNPLGRVRKLLAYRHGSALSVVAAEGNAYQLVTQYGVKGDADATFYVLNAFQQLDWDALRDQILLVDDQADAGEWVRALQPYVRNVYAYNLRSEMGQDLWPALRNWPFDMQCLWLCE